MDALNRVLQSYMFDMMRILTNQFVTKMSALISEIRSRSGYYYGDDAFLFLLKGGGAVKIWQQNTFPISDLGDMDCTILINPRLPPDAFSALHTFLFEQVHQIFLETIQPPPVAIDTGYYTTTIMELAGDAIMPTRDYGIFKDNRAYNIFKKKLQDLSFAPTITLEQLGKRDSLPDTCPFMIAGIQNIVFGDRSSDLSLFKLMLNTKDSKELIDIAIPHQNYPLLSYEFDLYSVATTMHTIASPSHLIRSLNMNNDPLDEFAIAKPIALLYELSVIQLPDFEGRTKKLEKRKGYIHYLKTRNNVRNNVRAGTTRKALQRRKILKRNNTTSSSSLPIFYPVPIHNNLMRRAGLNDLTFSDV